MDEDELIIYAIDPGKVTGVACYDPENNAHPEFWMTEDWQGLAEDLIECPVDHLVIEKFTINNRTAQRAPDGLPLRIIGALEFVAWLQGYHLHYQDPPSVMRIITDDVLKALGWYTPTTHGDHANDAARHLAVYALESRFAPDLKAIVEEVLRASIR